MTTRTPTTAAAIEALNRSDAQAAVAAAARALEVEAQRLLDRAAAMRAEAAMGGHPWPIAEELTDAAISLANYLRLPEATAPRRARR